jgi:hypothetical protein
MASIPSNGYREVMAGTNVYTGSNYYGSICPQTPIVPVNGNDLCNKTYVDGGGGGAVSSVTGGTNITCAPTTGAVVVNLKSPLTSTLTLGVQPISDSLSTTGTSGQLLSSLGAGGTKWISAGAGVSGIGGGNNIDIDISTPAVPVVNLQSPLTSTLALGTQNVTGSGGSTIQIVDAPNGIVFNASQGYKAYDTTNPVILTQVDKTGYYTSTATDATFTTGNGISKTIGINPMVISTTFGSGAPITITPYTGQDCNVVVSGAGKLHALQSSTGGPTQPILQLENTNGNANAVHMDFYKNSATPANDDIIGAASFHANNAAATSVEYARISATQRDITTASENGSLSFLVCENSPTPTEYLRVNGLAACNELYKPLETRGNTIRNTTAGQNLLLSNTANNQSIQINNTGTSGNVAVSATNQIGLTASGNFSIYGATTSTISCSQNLNLSVGATQKIIIPRNSSTTTHLITDDTNVNYYPDIIVDNANTNSVAVPAPIYEGQRLTVINKGVTPVASWSDYGSNYGGGCYSAVLSSLNEVWLARSDTNKVEVWDSTMGSLLHTIYITGWASRAYCFYEEGGFMFIGGSFTTVNGNATAQYGLTRCYVSSASSYVEDPIYDAGININGVSVSGGNEAVYTIISAFGKLYCGGTFTQFLPNILPAFGIFEVSNQTGGGGFQGYSMTGNGVAGSVFALYQNGTKLFIGGDFGSVDFNSGTPISYPRLATWDGTSLWEDVAGNGWNAAVYTLAGTPYGKVLVGGDFTSPQQYGAYVDSATPQSLASDSLNLPIGSISAPVPRGCSFYNGNVYIFTQTQGVFVSSSFQNWTDLNIPYSGTNSIITYFDNEVKVGWTNYGYFQDRNTAAQTCLFIAPSQLFRYNGSAFQNFQLTIPYVATQFVASGGYWYWQSFTPYHNFS